MSGNLFEVSGISLDNAISMLYGAGIPGTTTETDEAPKGSVYFRTDGTTYKKISSGLGFDKWTSDSVVSGITSIKNVSGQTVVDSLDSSVVNTGVWAITTSSVSNIENRQTVIITGSHNTIVPKFTISSKLDFGAKISGITYDVRLLNGKFEVLVFAPAFCNIDCYRLNAISNGGTVTLVGGGGGGVGDVTSAQLTSEINARIAGYAVLDTKINTKADLSDITTQLNTITTAISSEVSSRISADVLLQTAIDNISVGGGGLSSVESYSKVFNSTSHGFSVTQVLTRIGGVWTLSSAATDATAEVLGVVSEVISIDSFRLTFSGYMAGFSGLIDSATYYLDTNAGGYVPLSPTTIGTVSKPIFVAISTTEAIIIQSRGILN